MSVPQKNPTVFVGASRDSGAPSTSELNTTRGGGRASCVWSGSLLTNAALTGAPGAVQSGGHILLCSGPGRLNTVIAHQFFTSGVPVWFYDAAGPTVSGISVSGQRIIGFIPPTTPAALAVLSGNLQMTPQWNYITHVDMPFSSGLCAGAASGTPGFTVSFSPEIPGQGF